jgi:hypothetical protein
VNLRIDDLGDVVVHGAAQHHGNVAGTEAVRIVEPAHHAAGRQLQGCPAGKLRAGAVGIFGLADGIFYVPDRFAIPA